MQDSGLLRLSECIRSKNKLIELELRVQSNELSKEGMKGLGEAVR
jgi:hypothetical protein